MPIETLLINLCSSLIYDIGKKILNNGNTPITEEQLNEIINGFQNELNEILRSQSEFFKKQDEQNEIILKLLLAIYDTRSDITIRKINGEYFMGGFYSLDCLKIKAKECAEKYETLILNSHPINLGDAIWPISNKAKKELLDEIEQNLYENKR